MKHIKGALYLFMGAGIALLVKTYEDEIKCMCKKMIKKEKELVENGLDFE